ncbi:hypothetical protein Tco_0366653, partial [Tanacetum coccineum]
IYTSARNPVKEVLLKLNLPDHRILKDGGEDFHYSDTECLSQSDEVLKLKNFKKDATLKLSKSTNQEWYEHVGPEVTRSQDGKTRLWLVDDLTVLKITSSLTMQETDSGCWGFRRLYNLLLWLNWVAAASDSFSAAEKIEGNNYTKSLVC